MKSTYFEKLVLMFSVSTETLSVNDDWRCLIFFFHDLCMSGPAFVLLEQYLLSPHLVASQPITCTDKDRTSGDRAGGIRAKGSVSRDMERFKCCIVLGLVLYRLSLMYDSDSLPQKCNTFTSLTTRPMGQRKHGENY